MRCACAQRIQIVDEAIKGIVGQAHGSPLPPVGGKVELPHAGHAAAAAALAKEAATKASGNDEGDGEESDESEDDQQEYMFAVPLVDYAAPSEETADVKKVYALVDRLSYLDWGLRTEDEVGHGKKRSAALMSSAQLSWGGCVVHDGAMWGEAAHGAGNTGPKTARTSEGYGEATVSTAEKLIRVLSRLTTYVPAMGGWAGLWNLDGDATFLDIGSGYGKVVFHAKLNTGCRCAVGIECVAKRTEIADQAKQGLYCELDRQKLSDDLLKGVAFFAEDACSYESLDYSHVYIFDRVFSQVTLAALAKVLQRSSFYVMISTRKPHVWWGVGLSKIQPVAKTRLKTTGKEGMTAFIYINKDYIPGVM